MVKHRSQTGQRYRQTLVMHRPNTVRGDRAQRFGVAGGVAELEARAEMRLQTTDSKELGAEEVRVLRALLRRPLVAARLVCLSLR